MWGNFYPLKHFQLHFLYERPFIKFNFILDFRGCVICGCYISHLFEGSIIVALLVSESETKHLHTMNIKQQLVGPFQPKALGGINGVLFIEPCKDQIILM